MQVRGVVIEDTFAEAFGMRATRVVITARSERWAREAALKMTGFATSVIGCKCEAGIERELPDSETPDGRPGVSVLFFTMDSDSLAKRLVERLGQTVLTCPTTACFDGLPDAPERMTVGKSLRVFGDGFQISKVVDGRRYWRIPVMEGEFLIAESFGRLKGVGGGNFLILAESADAALRAAEASVDAMDGMPGVVLPFPGGVVRSGSKVGSKRYKGMLATTNDAFAPTLRAVTESSLPEGVNSVLEIVLDGLDAASIAAAMRVGIEAACIDGVRAITAGNYGGKLGPHHFHLRQIMAGPGRDGPAGTGTPRAGAQGAGAQGAGARSAGAPREGKPSAAGAKSGPGVPPRKHDSPTAATRPDRSAAAPTETPHTPSGAPRATNPANSARADAQADARADDALADLGPGDPETIP